MHMHKRMAELVLKQLTGEISEEEIIELNSIGSTLGLDPKLFVDLQDLSQLAASLKHVEKYDGYSCRSIQKTGWKYIKVAAVVIFLVGCPMWVLLDRAHNIQSEHSRSNIICMSDATGEKMYPWILKVVKESSQRVFFAWLARQNQPINTLKCVCRKKVRRPSAQQVIEKKSDIANSVDIYFKDKDLQAIINQFDAGKDYQVEYIGAGQPVTYTGVMPRNISMESFMQDIQLQSAHVLAVEGKKIIVSL